MTSEARWAPRHVPSSEWTSAADALSQIEAVAKAKSAKGYPDGTVLVIYLNVGFVAGGSALRNGMEAAVSHAVRAFGGVWVLDGDKVRQFYRR